MIGKPLNLSPGERVKHKKKLQERYLKRNRQRHREYMRALYRGTHHQWWINACRKAGIDI